MDSLLLTILAVWNCFHVESLLASNILSVFPLPYFSHFKTFQPLLEEIVGRGHNLTLLSSFSLDDSFQSNYTLINLEKYCRGEYRVQTDRQV